MSYYFQQKVESPFVSVPKSLANTPLSLKAKGLLFELLLTESDRPILEEESSAIRELLTIGFIEERLEQSQLTISLTEKVYLYSAQPIQSNTATLPVIDIVESNLLKSNQTVQTTESNKQTYGDLYDCLASLPLKSKLPQPNYHKLRAQILHWLERGIESSHIVEGHRWLMIEKGNSRFINWWDLNDQVIEVKALAERKQERQSVCNQSAPRGVNGHLHKHDTSSAFINSLNQSNSNIQQVFDYWKQTTQMRGELTIDRIRVIRNALSNFNTEELLQAIDGAFSNDYCQSKGLLSIADIFRNTDIIAKHIHANNSPTPPSKLSPAEQAINIALDDLPDFSATTPVNAHFIAKK